MNDHAELNSPPAGDNEATTLREPAFEEMTLEEARQRGRDAPIRLRPPIPIDETGRIISFHEIRVHQARGAVSWALFKSEACVTCGHPQRNRWKGHLTEGHLDLIITAGCLTKNCDCTGMVAFPREL
jgi:hypothetical protein